MQDNISARAGQLTLLLLSIALSGCDWVDSTGVQGLETGITLRNAEPVALTEGVALTAALAGDGSTQRNWAWELESLDVRQHCTAFDGFDSSLAQTTLQQACADAGQCSLGRDESSSEGEATRYTLQMPTLRAPVALSYRLQNTSEDGSVTERRQLLCGIPINEAPTAVDDQYRLRPGELLVVDGNTAQGLLANDEDDDDARNTPLTLQSISVQPRHAAQFSADERGGFFYQALDSVTADSDTRVQDQFIYILSDGLHQVSGTVTLNIVANNEPPQRLDEIPTLNFEIIGFGDAGNALVQHYDLAAHFSDPDADSLSFDIADEQLPTSGSLSMDSSGLLRAAPSEEDLGRYRVDLIVSDGIDSISERIIINVREPASNTAPVARDISNRIVSDTFSYDVSRFFSDADGDTLVFLADGLPSGVTIDEEGVISGRANNLNRGRWLLRVQASDGRGGRASDAFQLTIR